MRRPSRAPIFTAALLSLLSSLVQTHAVPLSFLKDIAPTLKDRCLECHQSSKSKGAYRLDTVSHMLKAGSSGTQPFVAGKPSESEFLRLLMTHDAEERMPKDADPLPPDLIQTIQSWIEQGTPFGALEPDTSWAPLVAPKPINPPTSYPQRFPVSALTFTPDGKRLLVGGYGEILEWSLSPKPLLERRLQGAPERIFALATSDDVLLAAGGSPGRYGQLASFHLTSGAQNLNLSPAPDLFLDATISPDRSVVALAGADHALHLVSLTNGETRKRIEQHADKVTRITFLSEGKQLLSVSRDKSARITNTNSGTMEQGYVEHGEPVVMCAPTSDGNMVSVARDRSIHLWSSSNGKKSAAGRMDGTEAIGAFTLGDSLWVIDGDATLREWSLTSKKPSGKSLKINEKVSAWCLSTAGALALGLIDGTVVIYPPKLEGTPLIFRAVP